MNLLIRSTLLLAATLGFAGVLAAKPWWMRGVESNEGDFLDPDVAFKVSSRVDGEKLRVRWVIADGYYLYRARFAIAAESPDLVVGAPLFPPGTQKSDPYLGAQEIFTQQVEAAVPFTRTDFGAHPLEIKVTYQGCAAAGLCYPPITKVIFPQRIAPEVRKSPHAWEGIAIIGGGFAFLVAGFALRRGRRLALPT